jgi:hypothetical protein
MTDGDMAAEFTQGLFAENAGNPPHTGIEIDGFTVGGGYSRAFLSTMLEGE